MARWKTTRSIIKLSASVFVALGGLVFAGSAVLALGAIGGDYGVVSPLVGFGGLVSSATVVLIGGTAYLLASIDERLERALGTSRSSSGSSAFDGLAAAQY